MTAGERPGAGVEAPGRGRCCWPRAACGVRFAYPGAEKVSLASLEGARLLADRLLAGNSRAAGIPPRT